MAKEFFDKDFKLGILGGGQLGRMFIQEAVSYNVKIAVLDPSKDAPCANIADEFTVGDFNDYQTVVDFGKNKDVVTIEIEHVNVEALKELEKRGVKVFPQPHVIELVQDKGLQKEFYQKHEIPTSNFQLITDKSEIKNLPIVQKLRKGGYDGRGVQVLKSEDDLKKAFDGPCVLEELVAIDKEISVIVARNEEGEVRTFPAVELEFNPKANLVEFLFSPANIDKRKKAEARDLAVEVAEKLGIVGLLAVEMFFTEDGELLVNEIAPRTHNSGHHTIEANFTSQFEQHLRSVLNMPLGKTEVMIPAVMVNLLGEPNNEGDATYLGLNKILKTPGVHLHLYGKTTTKPYRKMGHVTIINEDLNTAKSMARKVKNTLKVVAK